MWSHSAQTSRSSPPMDRTPTGRSTALDGARATDAHRRPTESRTACGCRAHSSRPLVGCQRAAGARLPTLPNDKNLSARIHHSELDTRTHLAKRVSFQQGDDDDGYQLIRGGGRTRSTATAVEHRPACCTSYDGERLTRTDGGVDAVA